MKMRSIGVPALILSLLMSGLTFAAEHEGEGAAHPKSSAPHESGANMNLLPPPQANKGMSTWPSKVTLDSPAALSKVSGGATTLKWAAAENADSYHVQVATDPNFKWLIANESFVKATTFDVKGLEAGKQYFWRVAGMKSTNNVEYQKGGFTVSSFEAQ